MTFRTRTGKALPTHITNSAASVGDDLTNRREFLALASSFGATAATAYAMIGLPSPARAQDAAPQMGGTARIQMQVLGLKDPRTYDWSEMGNLSRGWLEYLVSYENDGTFRPQLLESWEISDDATQYTLNLRKNVTWNNGDPFTAEDVARNVKGWCDRSLEGNAMASYFGALIDPQTDQALEGAIEVVDAGTVKLHLPRPDISLISAMAEYPAAITHSSHNADAMIENPIGTGPFLPESFEVNTKAVIVKNTDHKWWGAEVYGGPYLDRIEFIDFGTDPLAYIAGAEAEEIDMIYSLEGEAIDIMDTIDGWVRNEVLTASTVVIRPNQLAEIDGKKPYADVRVRKALALAVDNAVALELGYSGRGETAENHHVCRLHPEYAQLPPVSSDPKAAMELMTEAGMQDFEHEIISVDDVFRKDTADAVASMLRDAGFKVKRTVLPANTFWDGWTTYPFSITNWNHRPLGVQIWNVGYRSGEPWNEFGYASDAFDAILDEALATIDIDARRELMAKGQALLQEDAVTIQPYWRSVYNHTREGLLGGGHHISFEIRPERIGWSA